MNVRSNESKTMSSTPPIISTTISLDHDGTYVFSEVASAEVKIVNREIVMLTLLLLLLLFHFRQME
jgi:hypothetical protein